jgi:uncharacterized protein
MGLLRLYKGTLSKALPTACRFAPTCSEYAYDCFTQQPFFKALVLSVWRLARCHPFGKWGYDPAPRHNH